MKKIAFLFPGQGAQYPTMGKDFFDSYQVAREVFQEADELLSMHLSKLIFQGTFEELTQTQNSQVSIFVTCSAILRTVQKELPELTAFLCGGLSLGEYTALMASKKATFAETLNLVHLRGKAMQEACLMQESGMMIVFGLDEAQISEAGYSVANVNAPGQIVIGGTLAQLERAAIELKAIGAKKLLRLAVSGAFHTPIMRSAQEKMTPILQEARIQESSIDLVMNVIGDIVKDREKIKMLLIEQMTRPTRWMECIQRVAKEEPELYIEIGPTQLASINRKMGLTAPTIKIEKIEDLENVFETTSR